MSQDWIPLPYMERAASFLAGTRSGGLPLEPGGRKTSISLSAICQVMERSQTPFKTLVIAPLRVARYTWPAEIAKWENFNHLRVSQILGTERARLKGLEADADIYLVNVENVQWLCDTLTGKSWPFQIVILDELTRWKNARGKRYKRLRPFLRLANRRWGLTGSLTSNGYEDVFGQQLMLDDGAALGSYITRYRERYMTLDYDGYTWSLRPGSKQEIAKRLEPTWFQVDPTEYAQLPEVVDDIRDCPMEGKAKAQYLELFNESVLELSEGEVITAVNSGALNTKLSQLAQGAIYTDNEADLPDGRGRFFKVIHDTKIEALGELLDDLNGTPLLLAYEYAHDLARIQSKFGDRFPNNTVPYLGNVPAKEEKSIIDAWNRGALPLLCAHRASAGHGLNLQEANAHHVCAFGLTWSWELNDQFIRRVRRSGNTSERVFNHILRVPDTIDDLKLTAVSNKATEHKTFTALLGAFVNRTITGETPMNDTNQALPSGWGPPIKAAAASAAAQATPEQVAKIAPLTNAGVGQQTATQAPAAATQALAAAQRQRIRASVQQDTPKEVNVGDGAGQMQNPNINSTTTRPQPSTANFSAALANELTGVMNDLNALTNRVHQLMVKVRAVV